MTLAVIRIAWGFTLIAAPTPILRAAGGTDERRSRAVLRILGVRHLAQASRDLRPHRRSSVDPLIDGVHAATAAVLAVTDRRWRRPALFDAAVAASFAVAGLSGHARRQRRAVGRSS